MSVACRRRREAAGWSGLALFWAVAAASPAVGDPVREPMLPVAGGSFWYGCRASLDRDCNADEKPGGTRHLVAFEIDRTEVTAAAYQRCAESGACSGAGRGGACNAARPERASHPINCVSWEQAGTYCAWRGARLPSQGQWEKAARGSLGRVFPWGNEPPGRTPRANVADASLKRARGHDWADDAYDDGFAETSPVGAFPEGRSPVGALDMAGNVWEWTADPFGPDGEQRAVRGGSFLNGPRFARSSYRYGYDPGRGYENVGFRCAR